MDKRIIKYIGKRLCKDIDIEVEDLSLGHTIWNDVEIDDVGNKLVFVNLYTEISVEELNDFSFKIGIPVDKLLENIEILITKKYPLLLNYVFAICKAVQNYDYKLNHVEPISEFDEKNEKLIIDINLVAESKEEEVLGNE